MKKKLHVKVGDTVKLLTGKSQKKGGDRGKTGKVLEVSAKEGKVIVEGINKVTKHVKPRSMGEQGGIIEAEAPMYASKVQLVCPKCKKPTRLAHGYKEGAEKTSKNKMRKCVKCGALF